MSANPQIAKFSVQNMSHPVSISSLGFSLGINGSPTSGENSNFVNPPERVIPSEMTPKLEKEMDADKLKVTSTTNSGSTNNEGLEDTKKNVVTFGGAKSIQQFSQSLFCAPPPPPPPGTTPTMAPPPPPPPFIGTILGMQTSPQLHVPKSFSTPGRNPNITTTEKKEDEEKKTGYFNGMPSSFMRGRLVGNKKPGIAPLPLPNEININISHPLPIEHSNIPTLVKATYSKDVDIIRIHSAIRAIFESRMFNIPKLEAKIQNLKDDLHTDFLSLIEAEKISQNIFTLEKEINSLKSGNGWESYSSRVKDILYEYAPLASDEVKGIVRFSGTQDENEDAETINRRLFLISSYLRVAGEYMSLDITPEYEGRSGCPACGKEIDEDLADLEEGMAICECGYQEATLVKFSTYKDTQRVNVSGRSDYEDRSTFIKALDQFMGIRIPKIPQKLYEMLDTYFVSLGFPSGDHIKENHEIMSNGKKKGTSVSLLIQALSATSNSSYYNYINYIAANYWGWSLPDLSEIREGVIYDYDETQKVYNEIKERDSSLNVQIRLFLHLRARGYECEWSDFKIISSRESLEYHHRMWKIMCERTHVEFTPVI